MNWLKNHKHLLIFILLLSFIARVWRLEHPSVFYFDEVYHAFTAQAYARNDPRGYEWWHESPEEIPYCQAPKCAAYEWLHPPLAKLIQAGSIKLLGDQPFAWRYPGVLFSLGITVLLYLLGTKVFQSSLLGVFAAFVYSLDGLAFTSSRITMNDTYLAFWVTLALYLFLRGRSVWLVGLALGLAVATKWPGVFAIGFISLLWFIRDFRKVRGVGEITKKLVFAFLSFFLLPLIVYIASYGQFWLQGHTIGQFKELHQQIWWYQTNLKAEHPYSSRPHEWALLLRPLYAYAQGMGNERVQNIYLQGNPFVFWGGLMAALYAVISLFLTVVKKQKLSQPFLLFAVIVAYFAMFTPWFFSPRIMFVYHYVPAVPFLAFLLAWLLEKIWKEKKRGFVWGYLLLVLATFIYFYPHWTGMTVAGWWDKQYYWLSTWR